MADNAATPRASSDQAPKSRSSSSSCRIQGYVTEPLDAYLEYFIEPLDALGQTMIAAGSDQMGLMVRAMADHQRKRIKDLAEVIARDVGRVFIEPSDYDVLCAGNATLEPTADQTLNVTNKKDNGRIAQPARLVVNGGAS